MVRAEIPMVAWGYESGTSNGGRVNGSYMVLGGACCSCRTGFNAGRCLKWDHCPRSPRLDSSTRKRYRSDGYTSGIMTKRVSSTSAFPPSVKQTDAICQCQY